MLYFRIFCVIFYEILSQLCFVSNHIYLIFHNNTLPQNPILRNLSLSDPEYY